MSAKLSASASGAAGEAAAASSSRLDAVGDDNAGNGAEAINGAGEDAGNGISETETG